MACFLIACLFFTISWIFLALAREPADHDKVLEENPAPFWRGASRILKAIQTSTGFSGAHTFAVCDHGVCFLHCLRVTPL
jgi:hypothetical protein